MDFEMKDLLGQVGGSAALMFAAWIFLSYLQQRYVAAFERFRALVEDFRRGDPGRRRDAVRQQVLLYKNRCMWMRLATNVGVASAMLLIATLLLGEVDVIWSGHVVVRAAAAACMFAGLLCVATAAVLVVAENNVLRSALDEELADLPELRG